MTDPILQHELLGHGITRLTLNTPGSLNALSDAMLAALAAELGATLSGPLIELSGADPNALLEIISLRARSAAGS